MLNNYTVMNLKRKALLHPANSTDQYVLNVDQMEIVFNEFTSSLNLEFLTKLIYDLLPRWSKRIQDDDKY